MQSTSLILDIAQYQKPMGWRDCLLSLGHPVTELQLHITQSIAEATSLYMLNKSKHSKLPTKVDPRQQHHLPCTKEPLRIILAIIVESATMSENPSTRCLTSVYLLLGCCLLHINLPRRCLLYIYLLYVPLQYVCLTHVAVCIFSPPRRSLPSSISCRL